MATETDPTLIPPGRRRQENAHGLIGPAGNRPTFNVEHPTSKRRLRWVSRTCPQGGARRDLSPRGARPDLSLRAARPDLSPRGPGVTCPHGDRRDLSPRGARPDLSPRGPGVTCPHGGRRDLSPRGARPDLSPRGGPTGPVPTGGPTGPVPTGGPTGPVSTGPPTRHPTEHVLMGKAPPATQRNNRSQKPLEVWKREKHSTILVPQQPLTSRPKLAAARGRTGDLSLRDRWHLAGSLTWHQLNAIFSFLNIHSERPM